MTTATTTKTPRSKQDWIDDDGFFLFGKHSGEIIEHVARNDPSYIRWIVSEVDDITDGDRQILETLLNRR